ncbi:MAG: flagellar M-ring protein FliF [Acidobacteria bacterium 13_1_40CM_2_56_11]|nr:MAG: flagellar M-ring protein FliF [Acidobacteria bacterium 13_1_40CM_2_56_11]
MATPNPFEQIKTFFTRYSLQQKLALAGSAAMVLILLWVLVYFVNRVEYQTLYADLDPQEAQGIIQKLQELKVPYELEPDGRTVKVTADKIAEVRIQLASQGLPESGRIGFEIFDRTNFGLTNFQEQVNYQRALEGELARSIMTLAEVEAARVHLVLAKESLFQSSDEQTKASVILKLKNGHSLPGAAAQGIVNMVASAVKGLMPEKVVLVDYRGKILSRNGGPESGLSAQQLDARQRVETELAGKIVQILEPAVGQGKIRPQVSIVMNFEQVEETVEQYDPQHSVIRSEQKQQERQPKTERVGGIPGSPSTPSNNPAGAPAAQADQSADSTNSDFVKQNETINYEVSKAVRHVVNPVGKIERVSVAVVIDNHTKVTTGSDGEEQTSQEPRTPEEMKKYRDLVTAAIGFNPDRGDQLTVENISFQGETELIEKPGFIEKRGPTIMMFLRYLIIPVVFIILYLLFLRPVQKSVFANWATTAPTARNSPLVPANLQTPMTVKQFEAQLSGASSHGNADGDSMPLPTPNKIDMIRKRVVEHAQSDPEAVARLVRTWLADEKNG